MYLIKQIPKNFSVIKPLLSQFVKLSTNIDESFKGLSGENPCTLKSISGPEPNYNKLNEQTYKLFEMKKPFKMYQQGILPEFQLAYETWGELNASKDNAILIFSGLSANSHAKSSKMNSNFGWWEDFIGPNGSINTDKFFVICCNHLGSCFGSTGPSSINPITNKRYGSNFPILTVNDMINAQFKLLENLGIEKLHASVGSSLGGMCSLLSGLNYKDRVKKIVAISTCLRANPNSIAMRYLQRTAIMADPNWNNGNYYDKKYPLKGIKLAREIATVTYRSGPEWDMRFGRKKIDEKQEINLCPTFEIENYLNHQGETFASKYDPNSLLYLSKAMDLFDLTEGYSNVREALANIKCPVLVMGSQTDLLFPVKQQREIAKALKDSGNTAVVYFEMDSLYGHDTFLLNLNDVGVALKGFLETEMTKTGDLSKSTKLKD